MTTPLCSLALKYGCDKVPANRHSYTPFYHRLFRDRTVRRLLEIGVYRGASLRMWRDYFPEAEVVGFDIRSEYMISGEPRIHTYLYNTDMFRRNCEGGECVLSMSMGKFDVIIDDASHEPEDQVATAKVLIPWLADGGVYVIEDVWNVEEVSGRLGEMGFPHSIHQFRCGDGEVEVDDVLVVIER